MKEHDLIIFDADQTLRDSVSGQYQYPISDDDWVLLPEVKDRLATIGWAADGRSGVCYGIASNQSGVAYGHLANDLAERLLLAMFVSAFGFEPVRDVVKWCPHPREGNCLCRKPGFCMLEEIAAFWNVAPQATLFVGDKATDSKTAENFGCDFIFRDAFFAR